MIQVMYICHRCNIAVEQTRIAEDRFFPRACDVCQNTMQRTSMKQLLETWPGPQFPDSPPEAA